MANYTPKVPNSEEIERAELRRYLFEESRTVCPDLHGHLASLELLQERAGIYLGQDHDDDLSDIDFRPY